MHAWQVYSFVSHSWEDQPAVDVLRVDTAPPSLAPGGGGGDGDDDDDAVEETSEASQEMLHLLLQSDAPPARASS